MDPIPINENDKIFGVRVMEVVLFANSTFSTVSGLGASTVLRSFLLFAVGSTVLSTQQQSSENATAPLNFTFALISKNINNVFFDEVVGK